MKSKYKKALRIILYREWFFQYGSCYAKSKGGLSDEEMNDLWIRRSIIDGFEDIVISGYRKNIHLVFEYLYKEILKGRG